MDTLKYVVKRLLMAILILFGVSIIIYSLSRMMPTSYVDGQYASAVNQGTMSQEDVDRIKEIYGLYMPDAYLSVRPSETAGEFANKKFTKSTRKNTYERVQDGVYSYLDFYSGTYESGNYRLHLDKKEIRDADGTLVETVPDGYRIAQVVKKSVGVQDNKPSESEEEDKDDDQLIVIVEQEEILEQGTWTLEGDKVTLSSQEGNSYGVDMLYRAANFWDKAGSVLGSYFVWLGNIFKGDLGMSFKYKQPVGTVIAQNMGVSFAIAFIATILQFVIAIPLGIKAATNQYGVVDYSVTVLTMIGISLPTFFLASLVIRVFSIQLGWFPVNGLVTPTLPEGTAGIVVFGDMLWHMILPMFVLVILSVGSLMRYTRTNTLEVLNADYIRTARAKGLSERSVIYKHAFRNTMIPLVTLLAGMIPSLFGGAMITETVFAIPGIGKLAYDALVVADVPFIMGYNMFIAIMTVLGTLLSDLLYAVVDPRVKLK